MTNDQFLGFLRAADFKGLFLENGWDNPTSRAPVEIRTGETDWTFREVAQKKGFRVYACAVPALPDSSARRLLDTRLRKAGEHYLCVFVCAAEPFHHLWMVPVKAVDRRHLVFVEYVRESQAGFLRGKIEAVAFGLEETPSIVDVIARVNAAFLVNSEKVTKKFFQEFRKQHKAFVDRIEGVPDEKEREWYASVMLNRLMFCYFVQKKGFLDGDPDYLSRKLAEVQARRGRDKFYGSFYKRFLRALFADGLNTPLVRRGPNFARDFGQVPYLNGGMFDVHEIERSHPDAEIPDAVFEKLFAFFDQWHWHLDTKLTAEGNDINPDVLGYIFEQYINERAEMGAYYTKEDITEYIGRNCIVPWLLDDVARKSPDAFKPAGFVWKTLRESGDRYLFPALRKGVDEPLPDYVAVGVDPAAPGLRERRARWNEPAEAPFALPTEIWRETVARRRRCEEVRARIASGAVSSPRDLVTLNLDARAFAEDLVAAAPDHLFVRHVYESLRSVTVLDPTCGSGAFLFAALNILEPLYERCLDRMEEFHAANPRLFEKELAELHGAFRSNRRHFVYKSIILRNLYGVDIMSEAVEIAKLRLFLKMVAVVDADFSKPDENFGLDPLPDIDFNVRCGNTLVGYASPKAVHDALVPPDRLALDEDEYDKVEARAADVSDIFSRFRALQLEGGDTAEFKECKKRLRRKLDALNDQLDKTLASLSYSVDGEKRFAAWKASHKPFHWYSEFYDIIVGHGGFDVIIGNPPYVEYSKVKNYTVKGFTTESCGDLYAMVMERAMKISSKKARLGMIVPVSIGSTDGFMPLRKLQIENTSIQWDSFYSIRPSKLFEGVEKRCTITLHETGTQQQFHLVTRYYEWNAEEREHLFSLITYVPWQNPNADSSWPKLHNDSAASILSKIRRDKPMEVSYSYTGNSVLYHTRKFRYFVQFLDSPPKIIDKAGNLQVTSELKEIHFESRTLMFAALAAYQSSLFSWFVFLFSDCRNLNKREVAGFPFSLMTLNRNELEQLSRQGKAIAKNLQDNSRMSMTRFAKYGLLNIQVFQPRLSKPIIDEIDALLAKHYGFTEEELDFIVNYDIKYRMGDELAAGAND